MRVKGLAAAHLLRVLAQLGDARPAVDGPRHCNQQIRQGLALARARELSRGASAMREEVRGL